MQNANAYNVYKNNSVNYASKDQMLLMLVDGAVRFSKIARQAMINKDIQKTHQNIIKTQNIFYELMVTLDVTQGGQWAENLNNIYDFIVKKLAEVNIKKDVKILDEILPLIQEVRDTWNQAYEISKIMK